MTLMAVALYLLGARAVRDVAKREAGHEAGGGEGAGVILVTVERRRGGEEWRQGNEEGGKERQGEKARRRRRMPLTDLWRGLHSATGKAASLSQHIRESSVGRR